MPKTYFINMKRNLDDADNIPDVVLTKIPKLEKVLDSKDFIPKKIAENGYYATIRLSVRALNRVEILKNACLALQ